MNYAILLSAMSRENHAVLGGENVDFSKGGGINIRFRPKYRPLPHRGFDAEQHGCNTAEYKNTNCPLPPLLNVMYWVRVSEGS
jgi:hypothetical protein